MGGAYSKRMLSKKKSRSGGSQARGSKAAAALSPSAVAALPPSALAKILLTSETSSLNLAVSPPLSPVAPDAKSQTFPPGPSLPRPLLTQSHTVDENLFRGAVASGESTPECAPVASMLALYLPEDGALAVPHPGRPLASQTGLTDQGSLLGQSFTTMSEASLHTNGTGSTGGDLPYQHPGAQPRGRGSHGPLGSSRHIYNSCWTIHVDSTIDRPNLESTLRCAAYVLVLEMTANHRSNQTTNPPMYDTLCKPLDSSQPPVQALPPIPTAEDVFVFLSRVFKAAHLKADSAVIMLIYVHRMLTRTGIRMTAANWKRTTLGGLIMAFKVWEDQAVWNVDFCALFPQMRVSELCTRGGHAYSNELERLYLTAMDFHVNVKTSSYTRCYFLLRDVADLTKTPLTLQPLTLAEARNLETHMVSYGQRVEREYGASMGDRLGVRPDNFQRDMRRARSDFAPAPKDRVDRSSMAYVL